MTSLNEQILVVEKDIKKVEGNIEELEKAIKDCTDPEEKKQLLAEKIQLHEKDKQLRAEKLILLDAKHHSTGINILDG